MLKDEAWGEPVTQRQPASNLASVVPDLANDQSIANEVGEARQIQTTSNSNTAVPVATEDQSVGNERPVRASDDSGKSLISPPFDTSDEFDDATIDRTSLLEKIKSINRANSGVQAHASQSNERFRMRSIFKGDTHVSMNSAGDPSGMQENPVQEQKAVFVDASQMKQKVRDAIHSRKWDVTTLYHEKGICQKIAKHFYFENLTLIIIGLNAIWIWIEADYNEKDVLTEAEWYFQLGANIFCTFFFFEWTIRFLAFKRKVDCRKDTWFIFDTLLCFLMILETWVTPLIIVISSGNVTPGQGLAGVTVMRILKILRLTRMARMVRLLRAMPELRILVKGMSAAMRSVAFTLFLLCALIYVYALAFRQMTMEPGDEIGQMYFSSIPESMLTLLVYGALLDEISQLVLDLKAEEAYVLMFVMLSFIVLAGITVMNMLVGVLCEVVNAVAAVEKEELLVGSVHSKLMQIVQSSIKEKDKEKNRNLNDEEYFLTRTEFDKILGIPQAVRTLQDVGVDVVGLVDYTDLIFADDNHLSFRDFMDVVLNLRGTNTATVRDVVDLHKRLTFYIDNNTKFLATKLEKSFVKAFKNSTADMWGGLGRRRDRTCTEPVPETSDLSEDAKTVTFDELRPQKGQSFFMRGLPMMQANIKNTELSEIDDVSSDEEVRVDPNDTDRKSSRVVPNAKVSSREKVGDDVGFVQQRQEKRIQEFEKPLEVQSAPPASQNPAMSAGPTRTGTDGLATLEDLQSVSSGILEAIDQRFLQFESTVRGALRPLLDAIVAGPEESPGETGGTSPRPARGFGAVHHRGVGELSVQIEGMSDDPEFLEGLWCRALRMEEDFRMTFFELHELHQAKYTSGSPPLDVWPMRSSTPQQPSLGESGLRVSARQSPSPVDCDVSAVAGRLPMLSDPKCRPPLGPPPTPPPPSLCDESYTASRRCSPSPETCFKANPSPPLQHPFGLGNSATVGSFGQEGHGWTNICQEVEFESETRSTELDRAHGISRDLKDPLDTLGAPVRPCSQIPCERSATHLDQNWLESADVDEHQDEDQMGSVVDARRQPSHPLHDRPPTPEPVHSEMEVGKSRAAAFSEFAAGVPSPLLAQTSAGVKDYRPRFGEALPLEDMQWLKR